MATDREWRMWNHYRLGILFGLSDLDALCVTVNRYLVVNDD